MKKRCTFCGRISGENLCCDCKIGKAGKSLRDFFKEEKNLINLLTKDCFNCPINSTEFCKRIYENPQNEEEERELCKKYITVWLDFYEKRPFDNNEGKND